MYMYDMMEGIYSIIYKDDGVEVELGYFNVKIWKNGKLIEEFPVFDGKFRIDETAPWIEVNGCLPFISRFLQLRGYLEVNVIYVDNPLTTEMMHTINVINDGDNVIWLYLNKNKDGYEEEVYFDSTKRKERRKFNMAHLWTFRLAYEPKKVYKEIMEIFSKQP